MNSFYIPPWIPFVCRILPLFIFPEDEATWLCVGQITIFKASFVISAQLWFSAFEKNYDLEAESSKLTVIKHAAVMGQ